MGFPNSFTSCKGKKWDGILIPTNGDELKTRGVKCCPTAIFGVNNEKTSSFELKRIMI